MKEFLKKIAVFLTTIPTFMQDVKDRVTSWKTTIPGIAALIPYLATQVFDLSVTEVEALGQQLTITWDSVFTAGTAIAIVVLILTKGTKKKIPKKDIK